MASLPLFPSSFLPQGTASFVPSRPGAAPSLRPATPPATPAARPPVRPPVALPRDAIVPVPATPEGAPASPVDRTEAALCKAGLAGRFWRGDALSASPLPSTPSGFRLLDEQLPGGGWPSRCLTELLLAHPGVGEIRFLAATLSALTQAGREIVLLAPPHIPDPTGWAQLGIDMRRVLVVRTPRPADRLWALEESLKSAAFGALIAWLPEEKTLARHDALRRLQSAAASANGLSFLMRPSTAQYHPSPAPLRMTLDVGQPDRHRRTLSVRLLKRRGPVLAKPLTLLLPEVHQGLKAFSPVLTPARTRSTPPVAAAVAAAVVDRSAPATRDPALTSILAHALAGSLLPDAAA